MQDVNSNTQFLVLWPWTVWGAAGPLRQQAQVCEEIRQVLWNEQLRASQRNTLLFCLFKISKQQQSPACSAHNSSDSTLFLFGLDSLVSGSSPSLSPKHNHYLVWPCWLLVNRPLGQASCIPPEADEQISMFVGDCSVQLPTPAERFPGLVSACFKLLLSWLFMSWHCWHSWSGSRR